MKDQSPKYRRPSHELGRPVSTYHRSRGAVGAIVGALVPYVIGAAQHGPLLGGSLGVIALFGSLILICGAIGAGFGSSLQLSADKEPENEWAKSDLYDSMNDQGFYASRRDL